MDEAVYVDSPYKHSDRAQQLEHGGDLRHAEQEFKAAVAAADKLPLKEYREQYKAGLAHETVTQHSATDFETKQMVGSIDELERSYQELLALPFLTRLQLAGFYARNGALQEAREACEDSLRIGLDDVSIVNKTLCEMQKRAVEMLASLDGIIGPEGTGELFEKAFDKLDINKDGFVDESELKRAQLDLSLDADVQKMIRYLLYHYFEVEQASNDEFGMEISGLSKRDVKKFEKKKNSDWKRMHHPR
jgi:hypothetical protein